jgi:Na+/glutamate symporter
VAISITQSAKDIADHMINVVVVFLLQTMVIPLFLFWALFRVFTAMFQNSATGCVIRTEEASVLDTR